MDHPPLDLVTLNRRTLGNVVLRDDLLRLFREHGPISLGAVATSLQAHDAAAITAAAHRLKGSAATIAATELAGTARRIELAASAEDWHAIASEIEMADSQLLRCLERIDDLLVTNSVVD